MLFGPTSSHPRLNLSVNLQDLQDFPSKGMSPCRELSSLDLLNKVSDSCVVCLMAAILNTDLINFVERLLIVLPTNAYQILSKMFNSFSPAITYF